MLHERYYIEKEKQEKLLATEKRKSDFTTAYLTVTSIRFSQESIFR